MCELQSLDGPPLNEHRDKCGVADCAPTMMTSMRVPLAASRPQSLGRRWVVRRQEY